MKKYFLFLVLSIVFILTACGTNNIKDKNITPASDGPYIFNIHDTLKLEWVENNELKVGSVTAGNFSEIQEKFNLHCSYTDLGNVFLPKPFVQENYTGVDSMVMISDVHGHYDSYLTLLKANGIIDDKLHWKFGHGHLVVVGDVFDRGDKVTEIFWHLFGLEKEAARAGGMVHVLLGNHEVMVLHKDLRYIHEKYKRIEAITNKQYFDLYSENSVLGAWIRSKPAMITINDILFVHAGISNDVLKYKLNLPQINRLYSTRIIGKPEETFEKNDTLVILTGDNGPLWYRGFFKEKMFPEEEINTILHFYGKDHIVVGHRPFKKMNALFTDKVIDIDLGIGYDEKGEVLLCKNGIFYRGTTKGKRKKL